MQEKKSPRRRSRLVFAVLLVIAAAIGFNLVYWNDSVYWQRWWDTMTHLQPDHMNFSPTVTVGGKGEPFELPVASPGGTTIPDGALRAAERYAAEFDSHALIVVHWGVIQTEWYAPGWSRETPTQSQSMHKTVAALLVGTALAAGHIRSVEDPVGNYLPEWADDPRGAIRIRDLLEMTSGLALYRFSFNPFIRDSAFRFLFSSDRTAVYLATPLVSAPGETFEYNDINAALIGLILQRATGRSYRDWLDGRLWAPMGGQRAEVWLDREGPGSLAMAACCLLAPAMDWARIGVLMKDRGVLRGVPIIPPSWIDAMTAPSPRYGGYGYFTWLGAGLGNGPHEDLERRQSEPFLADDVFMLLGRGGQRVYVSRSHDLVVVRLGPHNGPEPLKPEWDNTRLMNLLLGSLQTQ